jgi:patatin-related protein
MAYQREIRLGMVLYGGVSLAVYENGVAQELYRAMRGDGVYGLIAKLIDSDVVIDIVSGTSAGGVNGIMLAYALANQCEFAPSADLWRNQGDIQALLRKENDTNGSSVLNSKYYQDKLTECFQSALVPDKTAPVIGELDLFVTSTDAHGSISTVFDDLGHAVDIKNHRALFKLQYRNGRKNDFRKATANDLGTLSRMTSCFPVAFEPVTITNAEANFFRWGKLRNPAIFLDGGILNNKPFTSTIEAIAGRTATREVERFLIYVEPKPEQFSPSPANPLAPTMTQAAFSSLVSIPGYQSIAGDLEAIETHNERAARLSQILDSLEPAADAPKSTPDCLATAGVIGGFGTDCDPTAYYTARLMELRDTVVECIMNDEQGRGYFPSQETKSAQVKAEGLSPDAVEQQDARRSGRILVQSFDAWPGDWKPTLINYDVFFRMRRAKHLSNTLMRAIKKDKTVPAAAWELANHYYKLYEMIKWALITWVNDWHLGWQSLSAENPTLDTDPEEVQAKTLTAISVKVWTQVEIRLQELLSSAFDLPSETSSTAREAFFRQLTAKINGAGPVSIPGTNLLARVDDVFKASLLGLAGSAVAAERQIAGLLCHEFCRSLEVDRQLFLLQVGSGFESTDLIRVVRFSPLDAQRCLSEGSVESKVKGSTLASFGGFFKKGWRANDIMMGRLDAACLLVECLVTRERLAKLGPRRVGNKVPVTAAELRSYFPNLSVDGAAKLETTINRYLSSPATATEADWNELVDGIVCASHDEIQREEWKRVIACSIEQEYAWSRYRNNPKLPPILYDPKNLVWNLAKERPDEVLVQVAAQAIAAGTIPPFAPGLSASGSFLEEIPDAVIDELAALAVIRIGKGLLASISEPSMRDKVAANAAFRLFFRWIAPIFYNWARRRRTQPDTVIIFNTAVPVMCLTILAVAVLLSFLHSSLGLGTWALLIFVPLALLAVWGWLFRR